MFETTAPNEIHAQVQSTGYSSDNSATEMRLPKFQSNIILIRCMKLCKTNSQNLRGYSLEASCIHKFLQFPVFLRVIQHSQRDT